MRASSQQVTTIVPLSDAELDQLLVGAGPDDAVSRLVDEVRRLRVVFARAYEVAYDGCDAEDGCKWGPKTTELMFTFPYFKLP